MNVFLASTDIEIEHPFDVINIFAEGSESHTVEIADRYKNIEVFDEAEVMSERTYMRQYIRVSNYRNIYQSEPYSVLDYTGDIGGIVSAIQLVFTIVISGIVYHLYITDLISETY